MVDQTPFDVSFGRDANGQLTVILAANHSGSSALHFSACGKKIDADDAVVTLTFSPDLKGLIVDPGYLGTVQVDSHLLHARSLADDVFIPSESISTLAGSAPEMATSVPATGGALPLSPQSASASTAPASPVPVLATSSAPVASTAGPTAPAPAPGATALAAGAASPGAAAGLTAPSTSAPPTLASQIKPILPPLATASAGAAAATDASSVAQTITSPDGSKRVKLYWAEPVTSPDGTAPSVATDEIRLVEVRGSVTVISPGGAQQPGTEGMVVESGATVRTASNSSAALFMGGVNSARLMPNCELTVTQALAGAVRTNIINLHSGAVFSRIGHRDGETENYSVTTPEGATDAETTDMLAYRGTPDQLQAGPTTGLVFPIDPRHLVAWNPASSHGLLSDVPTIDLGLNDQKNQKQGDDSKKGSTNTYFYYANSSCQVDSNDVRHEVYSGQGGKDNSGDYDGHGRDQGGNDFGNKNNFGNDGGSDRGDHGGNDFGGRSNDGNYGGQGGNDFGGRNNYGNDGRDHGRGDKNRGGGSDCQSQYVLQKILVALQPYNTKLKGVLADVDDGHASAAELKFYHELTSVFFCEQEPQIVDQYLHNRKQFDKDICVYDKVLNQDLCEFGLPALTPGARIFPL